MARKFWSTDAADEASGSHFNHIHGTKGNDDLIGTEGRDSFNFGYGGNDTAQGLGGDDRFVFGPYYTSKDMIDGGAGDDMVVIGGDEPDVTLDLEHLKSIERFELSSPRHDIAFADGFGNLIVTGSYMGAVIDASQLTTGSVRFQGDGSDFSHYGAELIGGLKGDTFFSTDGPETLTGGDGRDRFVYNEVRDSSNVGADLITDFDSHDVIRLPQISGGYHLSPTAAQRGDIAVFYDSESNQTLLDVNLDASGSDLLIYLNGDLTFKLVNDTHLILG